MFSSIFSYVFVHFENSCPFSLLFPIFLASNFSLSLLLSDKCCFLFTPLFLFPSWSSPCFPLSSGFQIWKIELFFFFGQFDKLTYLITYLVFLKISCQRGTHYLTGWPIPSLDYSYNFSHIEQKSASS